MSSGHAIITIVKLNGKITVTGDAGAVLLRGEESSTKAWEKIVWGICSNVKNAKGPMLRGYRWDSFRSAVNAQLQKRVGLGLNCMADVDIADYYHEEYDAADIEEAVEHVLSENDFPG